MSLMPITLQMKRRKNSLLLMKSNFLQPVRTTLICAVQVSHLANSFQLKSREKWRKPL
uniref:Alternative protein STK33 n=1 Tax=Homo sapiens TaxID=9606 RepID=L8E989_HUMAN|nr:alternative protein STK33 [Homo sapiens]